MNEKIIAVAIAFGFCSQALCQNSTKFEDLHRETNVHLDQLGSTLLGLCDTSQGCADIHFPADGTYDDAESDFLWLVSNTNCIRNTIWDIQGDGSVGLNSMLFSYADPALIGGILGGNGVTISGAGDLAPPDVGSLPSPPALLNGSSTIGEIEAAINEMVDVLRARNYIVGLGASGSAEVVTVSISSRYYTSPSYESDFYEQMVDDCARVTYADGFATTTTSFTSGNLVKAHDYGIGGLACQNEHGFLYWCGSVDQSWYAGFIDVQPASGYGGGFLVFAKISGHSVLNGGTLPTPYGIPLDGTYKFIASVGPGGGTIPLIAGQPPAVNCNNLGGWSISTAGSDNSAILLVAAPAMVDNDGFLGSDLGGCSPDLSGIGSADQPEAGEPADGAVMAPGCDSVTDSNPTSEYPISYATGHKIETVQDLKVSVTGTDWAFNREYSSDPQVINASTGVLLGTGWSADSFGHFVFEGGGQTAEVATLVGSPQNKKTVFTFDTSTAIDHEKYSARWHTGGPTSQTLRKARLYLDDTGVQTAVWILEEPGQWYMVFYRNSWAHELQHDSPQNQTQIPAPLLGKPVVWFDVYGNCRYYQYWDNGTAARLRNIYLNGFPDHNIADAVIQFDWELDGFPAAIQGMLDKVSVLRPSDVDGEYITTQSVDYVYGAELAVPNADVGSDIDLVSVERSVLMDATEGTPSSLMHSTFTHYRYHDGVVVNGPDVDERFEAYGTLHQLKAVIQPEQIEYVAQKRVEAGDLVSVNPEDAVSITSDWLLAQPDDGLLGSWDSFIVFDTASKVIGYNGDQVATEFIQTACGCGGGATQGQKISFDYTDYEWGLGGNAGRSVTESIYSWDKLSSNWSLHRTHFTDIEYLNGMPYTRYKVTEEPVGLGGRQWITEFEYDPKNNLSIKSSPSWFSKSGYQRASSPSTPPLISGTQSDGLRYQYGYTDDNRLERTWVYDSSINEWAVQQELVYDLSDPWLLIEEHSYPDTVALNAPAQDSQVDSVFYEYAMYGNSNDLFGPVLFYSFPYVNNGTDNRAISAVSRSAEAGGGEENGSGPDEQNTSYTVFDGRGQPVWSVREDDSMVYREFDSTTGQVSLIAENADRYGPADGVGVAFNVERYDDLTLFSSGDNPPVTSWGLGSAENGGELVSSIQRDPLGRIVRSMSPSGVARSTVRELKAAPSRLGILYPAIVTLPHDLGVGPLPSRYDGPATIEWMNAGGTSVEAASHALDELAAFDPLAETGPVYTLEADASGFDQGQLSRSAVDHTLSGLAKAEHVWHDVHRDASYTTSYEYDSLGRLLVAIDPVGTATYFGYDVLDRAVEQRIESTLFPGGYDFLSDYDFENATLISEQFYDADQSLSTPQQGVGNGLVTVTVAHTGEGAEARTTKKYFDNRDRLVGVVNEELPTYSYKYDNLDRIAESAVHSSLAPGGGARATDDAVDRGKLERTHYSQRGLVYLNETAVDPSSGSQFLRSDKWFDSRGRVIASRDPSSPMTKVFYDAHSRVVNQYTTDHGITVPGAGSYANASSISDDRVIEQVGHLYDDQSRLVRSTQSLRPHDALSSLYGELDGASSVRTYIAYFYDEAGRVIATANYGTGDIAGTVPFQIDLVEPVFPEPDNPAGLVGSGALVSEIEYNRRGIVGKATGPAGMVTRILYDDLARSVATIENAVNVDGVNLAWDNVSTDTLDHRWAVLSGFDHAFPEQDRVISLVYNGNGSITKRVAHYPKDVGGATAEGTQITEYVYGTDAGTSTNTQDTLVASGSLLFATLYPDESTGLPVRDSAHDDYLRYSVEYAYNRLGELRGQRDQNATQLIYERDGLGRTVSSVADWIDLGDHDPLTDLPGIGDGNDNFVDDAILRIETAYDDFGRAELVTSKDGKLASSAIKNQVKFTYTPLWQTHEVKQAHDGEVDGAMSTTHTVSYGWANDSASNIARLANTTYPAQDGGVDPTVEIEYGDAGSIDDLISRASQKRVESLGDDGVTHDPIVSYKFIGMSTPAKTRYDAALGIELSRTFRANGYEANGDDGNTGEYPGFDRFGRVRQQLWVDSGFGEHGFESEIPAFPPIIQKGYSYNAAHNREKDIDDRPRARVIDRDLDYQYDSLHRLKTAIRSGNTGSYQWGLDTFGNWEQVIEDRNGNGQFLTAEDFVHDWAHSEANELAEYTMSKPTAFPPGVMYTIPELFQYDDNGNMRRSDRSTGDLDRRMEYIYDAWNRLVRVQQVKNAVLTVPVLENEYNGLGWRTIRRSDTSQANYDGIDESRSYYYSPNWQLLEEHVDSDNDGTANWVSQQFWGTRHLNDAVAKRINHDPAGATPDYTDGVFFYLTDILYSPLAIVRDDSTLVNRVFFGAYGMAEHRWPGDVDGDGAATPADLSLITGLSGKPGTPIEDAVNYNVDAEYERDGLIKAGDEYLYTEQGARGALPDGWLDTNELIYAGSGAKPTADNSIGFAGAIFDPAIGMYHMRNRYYAPEWGRFINRDPLGYVDGQSMFEYVGSAPASYMDPLGLNRNTADLIRLNGRRAIQAYKSGTWTLARTQRYLRDLADSNLTDYALLGEPNTIKPGASMYWRHLVGYGDPCWIDIDDAMPTMLTNDDVLAWLEAPFSSLEVDQEMWWIQGNRPMNSDTLNSQSGLTIGRVGGYIENGSLYSDGNRFVFRGQIGLYSDRFDFNPGNRSFEKEFPTRWWGGHAMAWTWYSGRGGDYNVNFVGWQSVVVRGSILSDGVVDENSLEIIVGEDDE